MMSDGNSSLIIIYYTAIYTSAVKQCCQRHVLSLQKQACTSATEHKTQIHIQEYRKIIISRNTRIIFDTVLQFLTLRLAYMKRSIYTRTVYAHKHTSIRSITCQSIRFIVVYTISIRSGCVKILSISNVRSGEQHE